MLTWKNLPYNRAMMLVLQDFFGVIVHRSFYTQPTIMGFHNHWNNPWWSHNMRFHKFLVRHFIITFEFFFWIGTYQQKNQINASPYFCSQCSRTFHQAGLEINENSLCSIIEYIECNWHTLHTLPCLILIERLLYIKRLDGDIRVT